MPRFPSLPALLVCACLSIQCTDAPLAAAPLTRDASARPEPRQRVRAFYSGHSLSDHVPEAVAAVASSTGRDFDYEFQSLFGSLLRVRTRGNDPSAQSFTGYRLGENRHGRGLDVAVELRTPGRYDTLVVTERDDLPWSAFNERTPEYLAHMVRQLAAGNPRARVFFYHVWLSIPGAGQPDAAQWIAYERAVLPLWECVASSANRKLTDAGLSPNIRVLPGATALAALVEDLLAGKLPDAPSGSPAERLRWLFRDDVHPTPAGIYFMALVHYAALFGQSPAGATPPPGVSARAAAYMQDLAWKHVSAYAQVAASAAARDMAQCRRYAASTTCPLFFRIDRKPGLLGTLARMKATWRCQRDYENLDDSRNPFR